MTEITAIEGHPILAKFSVKGRASKYAALTPGAEVVEQGGTFYVVDTTTVVEEPAPAGPVPAAPVLRNREAWLQQAVEALAPLFAEADATIPEVRVSVGWPGGRGKKGSTIGQCWNTKASEDGVPQIFISPVLADGLRVLDVLAHELVHAWDDCQSGHKGAFAKTAKAIGLVGKMTATTAGDDLALRLAEILTDLGPYPHAALATDQGKAGEPKQTTRMLKVICPQDGYTIRTTAKWLEVGLPTCPCGTEMERDA